MEYYAGSCSGCGAKYSISMPCQGSYITNSGGATYNLPAENTSYLVETGNVSGSYAVDEPVKEIPPDKVEIMPSFRLEDHPDVRAMVPVNPTNSMNEIQNAINGARQVSHSETTIEMVEEIFFRRRLRIRRTNSEKY